MSERNTNTPDNKNKEKKISQIQEEYTKFKAKKIKEAAKKGNYGKARREAMELKQYLGVNDNEMPIEDSLETFEG